MDISLSKLKNIFVEGLFRVSVITGNQYAPLTILGYHSVSKDNTLIDITPKAFKDQIRYLIKSDYEFISLKDAYAYLQGKKELTNPSVVLTFDDGYADLLTNVIPYLQKKQIPATYFVLSHSADVNRSHIENNKKLMNTRTLTQLSKRNNTDIQGHSTKHSEIYKLKVSEIVKDLVTSKRSIKKMTKKNVDFFAYPWGIYNRNYVRALKKATYKAAFTTEPGFPKPFHNSYLIPRIMLDRTHSIRMFKFMLTPLYPEIAAYYFNGKRKALKAKVLFGDIIFANYKRAGEVKIESVA